MNTRRNIAIAVIITFAVVILVGKFLLGIF